MTRTPAHSAYVAGAGIVTPYGSDLHELTERLLSGWELPPEALESPLGETASVRRVEKPGGRSAASPRLRRVSPISLMACEAAALALDDSGLHPKDLALVFAATNGSVNYTRSFFSGLLESGRANPIFFPETVYNAPASHVAAVLGIENEVITLVGDAASAMAAIELAAEMISAGRTDACMVLAAEEFDWITWEAYHRWGLARSARPSSCGADLAEGAAAIVLTRQDTGAPAMSACRSMTTGPQAKHEATALLSALCASPPDIVVGSDSGAGPGQVETRLLAEMFPEATLLRPRLALGESFAAASMMQAVIASSIVKSELARTVLVSVSGWSNTVAGLVLTGSEPRG